MLVLLLLKEIIDTYIIPKITFSLNYSGNVYHIAIFESKHNQQKLYRKA